MTTEILIGNHRRLSIVTRRKGRNHLPSLVHEKGHYSHKRLYVNVCMYICMYVYVYVCMYVCMYVCIVCVYICMYVCRYVCV